MLEVWIFKFVRCVRDALATSFVPEFELQFADFEDRLSATLNLNDELEPIEIAEMFNLPGSELDDEMSTYDMTPKVDDEDMEILTEATLEAHPEIKVVN